MESDSIGESINIADVVLNLNGRDKGRFYFVISTDGAYVSLADGRSRKLESPKNKKARHVRFVVRSASRTAEMLRSGKKVTNAEVRRALADITAGAPETGEV